MTDDELAAKCAERSDPLTQRGELLGLASERLYALSALCALRGASLAQAEREEEKPAASAKPDQLPLRAFRAPEPGAPWWKTAKDCGAWTDRDDGDVGYVHFGSTEALRVYTLKIANQARTAAEQPAESAEPDLLEALQAAYAALLGYPYRNATTQAAMDKSYAAIAKATGKEIQS